MLQLCTFQLGFRKRIIVPNLTETFDGDVHFKKG